MGLKIEKRPLNIDERSRIRGAGISTAASTALAPNQMVALKTSSTTLPVVYTIADVVKAGDVLEICHFAVAGDSATSTAEFHLNAQSSGAFGYKGASTALNMITLSSGQNMRLTAINSSEWLVIGNGTLSTST